MKNQKILVAYFSATGTTRRAATTLAEAMNADLWDIKPAKSYSAADLDWNDHSSRCYTDMHSNIAQRPPLADKVKNMADYDVVFIGFPIWWDIAPTVINSFIESHDFKGKTVIPFATSGGSTIRNSCAELRRQYPTINWKSGKLLNSASHSSLTAWRSELGL